MKKYFKAATLFLTAFLFFALTDVKAMAAEKSMTPEEALEQLRKEDPGPDLSYGELISEVWDITEDGIPYVKRSYVKHVGCLARASFPSAIYTDYYNAGARGKARVTATFTYDISSKKVWVAHIDGAAETTGGVSSVSDEKTYSSGDYTEKATATYSCVVDKHLGGKSTWKASVSCNYEGRKC